MNQWKNPKEQMPEDLKVVIIEYRGQWRDGNVGGIRDAYAYNGEWINIPEHVAITRWMHIPE